MATEGPLYAGTAASSGSGDAAWATLDNAKINSDASATVYLWDVEYSYYADLTNFGFAIPAGATINGVIAGVRAKEETGPAMDGQVSALQLIIAGVKTGTIKSVNTALTTTFSTVNNGGISDVWACVLTPAVVNATNFGVSVRLRNWTGADPGTLSLAYVRLTVYYTAAASTGSGAAGGWFHPSL